jgi:deoxyribodipyrimidine photo-lyase
MWFRRDLRLHDNPALAAAAEVGHVVPLFVIDPRLWGPAGSPRRAYLAASLAALNDAIGGELVIRHGDPADVVTRVAGEARATSVHVAADYGPYGARRDEAVERALAEHGVRLERLGSAYAVAPGRVLNGSGAGYQVFSPFFRAWGEHGWRAPAAGPDVRWAARGAVPSDPLPEATTAASVPRAGEEAARERWQRFLDGGVDGYADRRDRPDLAGTSQMSVHLHFGEIHPRTMLADLAPRRSEGAKAYRRELAWRDFYADVLHRRPETARVYYQQRFARLRYDQPGAQLQAWQEGRTGFPLVDAAMRQLRETGWMHNRMRMLVASFLVKDLHLEWQHGARHFMRSLVDGDLASNQHGWQWVAGCGTDAAPYYRVFNPVTQGRKFDPDGAYVRRWVPELADVPTRRIHEPGQVEGYPAPICDHAAERAEALRRLEEISQ